MVIENVTSWCSSKTCGPTPDLCYIRNLRNLTEAPNPSLQQLIQLNKEMYPGAYAK